MIFPTHAPFPQMRPGMGYSPGAWGLGRTVSHLNGMGYLPGASTLRGLGAISASREAQAVAAGVNQSDLDLLSSLGATDDDIADLLNGSISLTALYAEYGTTIPVSSPAQVMAVGVPTVQVPPGSTLLYTATWTAGLSNLADSPNSVISQLGTLLSAHGMSVLPGSQATSSGPVNYGIQVSVLDTIGNALQNDAKSVLDALMVQIVGNNMTGSQLSITSIGPSGSFATGIGSPNIATSAIDPVTWLENNALYIGLFVGGIFALKAFTGKR